jgi:hypothetical protein
VLQELELVELDQVVLELSVPTSILIAVALNDKKSIGRTIIAASNTFILLLFLFSE